MSGNPNERAERLAGRWGPADEDDAGSGSAGERDGGGAEAGSGGGASSTEEVGAGTSGDTSGADGNAGDSGELTTREMQSQMLYLSPEFHRELDLTYEELDLRFRRERDRRLQKNRDFYAGLLRLGLARLGDAGERDLDEVEELLGVD